MQVFFSLAMLEHFQQLGLFTFPLFQQALYSSHQHPVPHLILVAELAHFVKILVRHPITPAV
jgi:hypothetical protein